MSDEKVRFGIRRYDIRSNKTGDGWGAFIIDDRGYFAVVSDFGNYSYWWTHIGEDDFRQFLCRLDADYLCGKLAPTRVYDCDGTEKCIREHILRWRSERRITKELARKEWDHLDFADIHGDGGFVLWMQDSELPDRWDADLCCYERPPQAMAFCKRLYPRFVKRLRDEMKAEAQSPPEPINPVIELDSEGAAAVVKMLNAPGPVPPGLLELFNKKMAVLKFLKYYKSLLALIALIQ